MPTLQAKAYILNERQERDLELLGMEMILAMNTFIEPIQRMNEAIVRMVEPVRQAQEAMERLILPIKIMLDALNISMLPMMRAIEAYAGTHSRMVESVSLLGLNNIARVGLGIVPRSFTTVDIIDDEI